MPNSEFYFSISGGAGGGGFVPVYEISAGTTSGVAGADANIWNKTSDPLSPELGPAELSLCRESKECGSGFVCLNGICVDQSGFKLTGDPNCGNAVDTGGSGSTGGCINSQCVTGDSACPSGLTECRPDNQGVVTCECVGSCDGDAICGAGRICVDGVCMPAECAEITELVDCGYNFTCEDGRCFPNFVTCNDSTPCPYGYSCAGLGVCVPDPATCSETSDCEAGYECVEGKCLLPCTLESTCPIGYSCSSNGYCEPDAIACGSGNSCPSGYTCRSGLCVKPCDSGSCPYNFTCVDGYCMPDDYVCPPGTTLGQGGCKGSCSVFCDNYQKTYGTRGPGCNEAQECDACNECNDNSLCVAIQENNPCWCVPPQDAPYCFDCAQDGASELNCKDCEYCYEIPAYMCQCGVQIESVKICRSACEEAGSIITDQEIESKAIEECAAVCGTNADCYGFCDTITYELEEGYPVPPCPTGYTCSIAEGAGGSVDLVNLGSYCQSTPSFNPSVTSAAPSTLALQALNVQTGETENISFYRNAKGTRHYEDGGLIDFQAPWESILNTPLYTSDCPLPAISARLYDANVIMKTSPDWRRGDACPPQGDQYPYEYITAKASKGVTGYHLYFRTLLSQTEWNEQDANPTPSDSAKKSESFMAVIEPSKYDLSTARLIQLSSCGSSMTSTDIVFRPTNSLERYTREECLTEGLPLECAEAILGNLQPALAISVIDEDSSYGSAKRNQDWNDFRAKFSDNPFLLLVPASTDLSVVGLPDGFDGTNVLVTRPGDGQPNTDWWAIAQPLILPGIEVINVWIDTSGSMSLATVQDDFDTFRAKALEAGYTVNFLNDFTDVQTSNENYIEPHLTTVTTLISNNPQYCPDPDVRVQLFQAPAGIHTGIHSSLTGEVAGLVLVADMINVTGSEMKYHQCPYGQAYYQASLTGVEFENQGGGVVTITSEPASSDLTSKPYFRSLRQNAETGEWEEIVLETECTAEPAEPVDLPQPAPPIICGLTSWRLFGAGEGNQSNFQEPPAVWTDNTAITACPGGELCGASEIPSRGFWVYNLGNGSYRVDYYESVTANSPLDQFYAPEWSQTYSSWQIDQMTVIPEYASYLTDGGKKSGVNDKVRNNQLLDMISKGPNNTLLGVRVPGRGDSVIIPWIPHWGGCMIFNTPNDPYDVTKRGMSIPSGEHGFEIMPPSLGSPVGAKSAVHRGGKGLLIPPNKDFSWFYKNRHHWMHGAQGIYSAATVNFGWDGEFSSFVTPETPCQSGDDVGNIAWAGECGLTLTPGTRIGTW